MMILDYEIRDRAAQITGWVSKIGAGTEKHEGKCRDCHDAGIIMVCSYCQLDIPHFTHEEDFESECHCRATEKRNDIRANLQKQ